MRFPYTFSGTININGKDVPAVLDTEALDFVDKLRWVVSVTTKKSPAFEPYLNRDLDGKASLQQLNLRFTDEESGRSVLVDAFWLQIAPDTAAHDINRYLILNIPPDKIGHYEPPKPPGPQEDWKVPGSPLTGPLPGTDKYFDVFNVKPGDEWRSPVSGKLYKIGWRGGIGGGEFSLEQHLFARLVAQRQD